MELTNEQKLVLYNVVTDIKKNNCDHVIMAGAAGTGKSTLIQYLIKFFPTFAVAAYTGKASSILRKRGVVASTIHSRIYKPYFDNGVVFFDLTDDPGCDGFIIDESSMVSESIFQDLQYFKLPIIFVGDHRQLEPIDSKFNLMLHPDYKLETIHRNAGDIARFAEHLWKGYKAKGFSGSEDKVEIIHKDVTVDLLLSVDQVICAYNKTRVENNAKIREALGFSGIINVGERVICLKNDRKQGLFNGMQGKVVALYSKKGNKKYMDFEFDGTIIKEIWYDPTVFGQESYKAKHVKDTPNAFDYAYCLTAHKSQGDQFDHVLVIEQKCKKWDNRRWAYTAASRAISKLKWKIP